VPSLPRPLGMDSFSYGAAPRGRRARRGIGRSILIVLGLVVAGGAAAAWFSVTRSGGEAVVQHARDTTVEITHASDTQAQAALQASLMSAKTAFVEDATFEVADAEHLSALSPDVTFVDGATVSSGPGVVSVQGSPQAWGAAVMSDSGTCFWIRETVAGGTAYGSGDPCTGAAAMSSTAAAF
jgi:hypothetical protein